MNTLAGANRTPSIARVTQKCRLTKLFIKVSGPHRAPANTTTHAPDALNELLCPYHLVQASEFASA